MIKAAFQQFLYAFYPRRCALCGEVVALDEERCDACRALQKIKGETCPFCGREKENCHCKRGNKPEYKRFAAPYYYDGQVVVALKYLKDYGFRELTTAMGHEITDCVKERYQDITFDMVCYIPMTVKRERKRGFNQSKLLAEIVANELSVPLTDALVKTRNTKTQRSSSAQERRINLHGAFDLAESINVQDKTILLIDDVKTTGSTLNECAMVLNGYGAKNVYAAAFCLTKRK